MLLPLQHKVEKKIHEAVDIINQIMHSTNDSISDYFEQKYEHVNKLHIKLHKEVDDERMNAMHALDKMISNSNETVLNLQRYFAEFMDLTMEKTYSDIKSILENAVSKIDTVSRDIRDNLKASQESFKKESLLKVPKTSIADLLDMAIESIKKLAYKFKNEPLNKPANSNYILNMYKVHILNEFS